MMSSVNPDDFAHLRIPLEDVLSATNNFDDENVVHKAVFRNVYRGHLLWSGELIEIDARRLNKERNDEIEQQFWMEISMLSSLKHKNVVSLGFCDENDEKIIIIRRGRRGSLGNYLSDPMELTWVRRLEISVGIAHALSYIHYDEQRDFSVIHRNINSGTVYLNDDWEPKLCAFERSMKIKASQRHHSFNNGACPYVPGYVDSTLMETNTVNHKSDIYSFGVVLFELLCGRESDDDNHLAPLAITHYREKRLDEIIDWDLRNQMDSQSFDILAETAYDCLNEERSQRPNIDEIVMRLEKALELQLKHQNAEIATNELNMINAAAMRDDMRAQVEQREDRLIEVSRLNSDEEMAVEDVFDSMHEVQLIERRLVESLAGVVADFQRLITLKKETIQTLEKYEDD